MLRGKNEIMNIVFGNSFRNNMANKILIIGVGSAGVIAADKMDIPNSKKLFIDSNYHVMSEVKSKGDMVGIVCKARAQCPLLYCHCFDNHNFCREVWLVTTKMK
jgi:hypothetical protein